MFNTGSNELPLEILILGIKKNLFILAVMVVY